MSQKNILSFIILFYSCYLCVCICASSCDREEIPCDDGQCISRSSWCDRDHDCDDGSDEAYCKGGNIFYPVKDPNKCQENHFLCKDGMCIPEDAHCDGYDDCRDESDEKDCSASCDREEIPCDDGQCIPRLNWCNRNQDCDDGSDEAYCKKNNGFFPVRDPNECQETHFLCRTGMCIPDVAHCDGYDDCRDESDEKNCVSPSESAKPTTRPVEVSTIHDGVTTVKPSKPVTSNEVDTNVVKEKVHPLEQKYFSSDQAVDRAVQWLFSVRQPNYGWGDNTARALIAIGLVKPDLFKDDNKDSAVMKKQLQIQITVDLFRTSLIFIPPARLALYVNALLATCQDPRNFHGMDLVRRLRSQTLRNLVNPFVLLTLCLSGESMPSDVYRLFQSIGSQENDLQSQDMQIMSTIAFLCIQENYSFALANSDHFLKRAIPQIRARMSITNGSFGNVYSTALAVQAFLIHSPMVVEKSLNYLASHQQKDGSFGDFLSTYYILPTLAKRSLLQLKSMPCHPDPRGPDGMVPIETLLEHQGPRYFVTYSLHHGDRMKISHSIKLDLPYNTTFFNIMRLAQHMDEKFRFSYQLVNSRISVYSIGGIPNDAERGNYWHLYDNIEAARHLKRQQSSSHDYAPLPPFLKPYTHGVQTLVPKAHDHIAFWYKSIHG